MCCISLPMDVGWCMVSESRSLLFHLSWHGGCRPAYIPSASQMYFHSSLDTWCCYPIRQHKSCCTLPNPTANPLCWELGSRGIASRPLTFRLHFMPTCSNSRAPFLSCPTAFQ
ncbi:hypothetical protein CsSME_00053091 [Camellia sinensis var. sinensis]